MFRGGLEDVETPWSYEIYELKLWPFDGLKDVISSPTKPEFLGAFNIRRLELYMTSWNTCDVKHKVFL